MLIVLLVYILVSNNLLLHLVY